MYKVTLKTTDGSIGKEVRVEKIDPTIHNHINGAEFTKEAIASLTEQGAIAKAKKGE